MFEDKMNCVTELLGVAHLKWEESFVNVSKRSYSALAFRIKGEALVEADGREYSAGVNDLLYIPQNTSYSAKYSDTEILVIHFKTVFDDTAPKVLSVSNSEQVYQAFLKMYVLWDKKEPGYQEEILSIFYGVLAELSRKKALTDVRKDYLKGISFMNANFKNSSISVPQICKEAGMSETNFRKFLKLYCGKSPIEYLTQMRLEYARNLIACGVSVNQAAYESGFNDPKYFSRTVKKYFGCTARDLKTFGK